MSTPPTNFIARPEHILIGLLRAIFGRETLFEGLDNEFVYRDNRAEGSLIIGMAKDYNKEQTNAQKGIYIQSGGGNESQQALGGRRGHEWDFERSMYSTLSHNYMIHCLTRHMGSSQFLQAAVMRSISSFRHAIYEQGIDSIPPLSFLPVQELSSPEGDRSIIGYDAVVSLTMSHDIDWILVPDGLPEEMFEIQFQATIDGGEDPIDMTIR